MCVFFIIIILDVPFHVILIFDREALDSCISRWGISGSTRLTILKLIFRDKKYVLTCNPSNDKWAISKLDGMFYKSKVVNIC